MILNFLNLTIDFFVPNDRSEFRSTRPPTKTVPAAATGGSRHREQAATASAAGNGSRPRRQRARRYTVAILLRRDVSRATVRRPLRFPENNLLQAVRGVRYQGAMRRALRLAGTAADRPGRRAGPTNERRAARDRTGLGRPLFGRVDVTPVGGVRTVYFGGKKNK